MADSRSAFLARARQAIQDQHLQDALDVTTGRFLVLRQNAFRGVSDPDGLRERAKAIKQRTLRELDRHLTRLATEIERVGGRIHFAADGQECGDLILRLARERGVRSVVKSKSMASEEIHLNAALEAVGITVAETDLGEWIIQLAGETPSHIIAPAIHQILARSATGQKMSVYTSLLRGPRRAGEADGPEEVHLIILDNGRSRQLAGPLQESLHCLRCGACLNVCPVYKEVGGHTYDSTYPGPIGIILTAFLGHETKNLSGASTLCGACLEVCPVKIDIPGMLLDLRHQAEKGREIPWGERWALKAAGVILRSPVLYRLAVRLGRILQRPFLRDGYLDRLPRPLAGWTRFRDLPPVAAKPFHARWKELRRGS